MTDIKIITNVCNEHFVILRYDSKNIIDAKKVFNKLNYKYSLQETWFMTLDKMIFSVSFNVYNWLKYKSMLYEDGISKEFRIKCLKNRYGFMVLKPKSKFKILYKFNESFSNNQEVKNSVGSILTKRGE